MNDISSHFFLRVIHLQAFRVFLQTEPNQLVIKNAMVLQQLCIWSTQVLVHKHHYRIPEGKTGVNKLSPRASSWVKKSVSDMTLIQITVLIIMSDKHLIGGTSAREQMSFSLPAFWEFLNWYLNTGSALKENAVSRSWLYGPAYRCRWTTLLLGCILRQCRW